MEPGNQLGGADAQIKYLSEAFRSKNNKAQKDINTVKNKLATTVSKLKKIKISMQKAKAQLPREANAQQAGGYQTSASIQSSPVTQFGKMDSAKNNIEDFCDEVENNIKKFSLTDTGKAKPIGHSSQTPAMGNSLKKDTKLKSNRVPSSLR
jgi:archaellum component FlaC